ncbi:MAG: SDR family oxidoreductase, partial [Streptomyces sp.]|uniref:SDR family oxidoreductase n=1 Tax=Streptomyces sp. TaxID=1931 RepID=UPI003D6AF9B2
GRHMIDAGWGRIVNISSISAVGDAGRVGYASAKAGLIGFTKTLALELGPRGITANAIAPRFVVSDMTRASARRLGLDFADFQRNAAQSIPVRRVGRPGDIAHTASYLVSPDAGFVSGQVLYVAGGPVD